MFSTIPKKVIQDATKQIYPTADRLAKTLRHNGKDIKFSIIGGFVRDYILANMKHIKAYPNDIDIIPVNKIDNLKHNPKVLRLQTNIFGGKKFYIDGIGKIDIWDMCTSDIENVYKTVDFNCNVIAYTYPENKIFISPEFKDFIKTETIKLAGGMCGGKETLVMRALKFQIKFQEKFGLDAKLDNDILNKITTLSQDDESRLLDYLQDKINAGNTMVKVLESYKRLR